MARRMRVGATGETLVASSGVVGALLPSHSEVRSALDRMVRSLARPDGEVSRLSPMCYFGS